MSARLSSLIRAHLSEPVDYGGETIPRGLAWQRAHDVAQSAGASDRWLIECGVPADDYLPAQPEGE